MFQRPSQRPSQSAIFLSELRVVLPLIVLPLKTPPCNILAPETRMQYSYTYICNGGVLWTGLPDRTSDKIRKKIPTKMSRAVFAGDWGNFQIIFRHFSDIFSTVCHDSIFLGSPATYPLQTYLF